ncbi:hypothetical protein HYC85_009392 [Camellia sinensis]|uniref:CMP-sialic acid transporter 4 n=1 Tax=Camellia sinensis TaxID=4442 RepID=A0A7J7HHH4_CAMSI|nr:hypothetical protein HYC85_009392 [Camellia sinensis]
MAANRIRQRSRRRERPSRDKLERARVSNPRESGGRKVATPMDKDEDAISDDIDNLLGKAFSGVLIITIDLAVPVGNMATLGGSSSEQLKWRCKSIVTLALTVLTSSQAILIVWSKRAGKYDYSVTTANFMPWLSTTLDEVSVYPIPAALYLIKNLLQYYIFAYVDAPGYQILKNLNIISTGVLYRIILKRKLSEIQWAAFILLCAGCTTAQLNPSSDRVLQTPFEGWVMAIVMALLSGFAGVYTQAIIKKRPSRNIMCRTSGYTGIAVSMVMKYADNIVKVYSTSVAMLLTAVFSVFLFGFHLSLAFFLGSTIVSVSVYLHSVGKAQR